MPVVHLSPLFQEQSFDAAGNPLSGGKLYTYQAGTTTPLSSYTDSTGTTAQANPIVLNSRGEPASPIWLDDAYAYKFALYDSTDVLIRTVDNVTGVNVDQSAPTAAAVTDFNPGRNVIINGAMAISQRGTATSAADGTYTLDRWKWTQSGAGVVDVIQTADAPTIAQAGRYFDKCLHVDVTTADASIAAGDYYAITQPIEGINWQHIAQRSCTLQFWVKATKTGTYCVALKNPTDRAYVAEYTVSASDTWEYKTVTFTASPSAGTWDYGTSVGANLVFTVAAGSTYQTTGNAWQSGSFFATSSQVNGMDSASNNFKVTGVQLESGSTATAFQFRQYSDELDLCQRYYHRSGGTNQGVPRLDGYAGGVLTMVMSLLHPVPMRAAPTVTKTGTWTVSNCGQPSSTATAQGFIVFATTSGAGAFYFYPSGSSDYIGFSAEL